MLEEIKQEILKTKNIDFRNYEALALYQINNKFIHLGFVILSPTENELKELFEPYNSYEDNFFKVQKNNVTFFFMVKIQSEKKHMIYDYHFVLQGIQIKEQLYPHHTFVAEKEILTFTDSIINNKDNFDAFIAQKNHIVISAIEIIKADIEKLPGFYCDLKHNLNYINVELGIKDLIEITKTFSNTFDVNVYFNNEAYQISHCLIIEQSNNLFLSDVFKEKWSSVWSKINLLKQEKAYFKEENIYPLYSQLKSFMLSHVQKLSRQYTSLAPRLEIDLGVIDYENILDKKGNIFVIDEIYLAIDRGKTFKFKISFSDDLIITLSLYYMGIERFIQFNDIESFKENFENLFSNILENFIS